jgi:hypothetical protein
MDQTLAGGAPMTARRAGLLVLCVIGAACVDLNSGEPTVTLWETQLEAEPDFPGVAGQAAAVSSANGTEAGAAIRGAEPDATHPWSVRLGSCAGPGDQIGADDDYPELEVSEAGRAEANARFGLTLSLEDAYHVEVRLSASDRSRVACGDLVAR